MLFVLVRVEKKAAALREETITETGGEDLFLALSFVSMFSLSALTLQFCYVSCIAVYFSAIAKTNMISPTSPSSDFNTSGMIIVSSLV